MSGFPPIDEERLRRELVRCAHALHHQGWVANHDGNISARLAPGRLLATPTAVSKGDVQPEWLIVVDQATRAVLQGTRSAFSELQLHQAAYAARPDIGVVIHAHPPSATAFAVSGEEMGHPFMAEPVVTLGPEIPTVPYHRPGDPGLDGAIAGALGRADVLILGGHGVLAVGGSLEQALLRLELVEHLAKISLAARALGGPRRLPREEIEALAKGGRPKSSPCYGEAPSSPARASSAPAPAPSEAPSGARPDVGRLVADTLSRFT